MYPTEKEIMKGKGPPLKKEIETISSWKRENYSNWSSKDEDTKKKAIKKLILAVNEKRNGKRLRIKFDKNYPSCYNTKKNLIILHNNSIITALHELGHHLFGKSELRACRYSIWIFKTVFPTSFNKLKFKGHLLIK